MATRILPLGASTTEGQSDSLNYRVQLANALINGNYATSFVGSNTSNTANCPAGYKAHEGHSSWCTSDAGGICQPGNTSYDPQRPIGFLEHIDAWLAANPCDMVLFLAGVNDGSDSTVQTAMGQICDKILAANPNTNILVSKVRSRDDPYTSRNNAIATGISGKSHTVFFDAYAGIDPANDFADSLHLNASGYTKMANNWFAQIQTVLNPTVATIDPTTPAGVQPSGFSAGFTLTMSDEFNSTTLDSKWRAFRDFGDFTAPTTYDINAGNNSLLRMWWTGNTATDNMIFGSTGANPFHQRFGFFEARVKCIHGKGYFPAFWLYPQSNAGAENPDGQQQEIDIVEWFSYDNGDWVTDTSTWNCKNASFTIWQEGGGGATTETGQLFIRQRNQANTAYDTTISTTQHTYGLYWHADGSGLDFYFDGAKVGTIPDPWGAANNMLLAVFLQLWWGPNGGNPTPDGTTPAGPGNAMEWDYVRVWRENGAATPGPSPTPTPTPTFHASLTTAPNDGATLSGTVYFRIDGEVIGNAELLPPTGYTPSYLTFTVSGGGTIAEGYWDTTQIANGQIQVRISAFNTPPGDPNATEIVVMATRTYTINNVAPTPGALDPTHEFSHMDLHHVHGKRRRLPRRR